mmetsp:Transcript_11486/g.43115  ORF Transcript_11486/g.43115 Transcript_11486/m.43115 type:complete len:149 (-) Transcript_11486:253-699(-)|eukprot:CAMPEP_0117451300 /NCGR_PEP_ID=MMETSP0759-20121206/8932_1 /TAXON_ID=63605 /ORGANISM="Percolomonas cosmopolitus, Strain WS" /LENGTH=148 /DNA_ID=CAMNT_0005243887 /DNA_START=187 /DNA_END=633 /DNA_ORIENTATION=-
MKVSIQRVGSIMWAMTLVSLIAPSHQYSLNEVGSDFDRFLACTWCKVGVVLAVGFCLVFSCLACLCCFVFGKVFIDAQRLKRREKKKEQRRTMKAMERANNIAAPQPNPVPVDEPSKSNTRKKQSKGGKKGKKSSKKDSKKKKKKSKK